MAKYIIFSVFFVLFISCDKEDMAPSSVILNEENLVSQGPFVPTSGISVTGVAKIYVESNSKKVVLENFTISEGPDLKVYLSKSATPNEFINLGSLTTATVYSIPEQVDLSQYGYVLIHCERFNHLYAIAELK